MSQIPPSPKSRRTGLITWLEEFYLAWLATRPLESETINVEQYPDGSLISLKREGAVAAGGAPAKPWEVVVALREGSTTEYRAHVLSNGFGCLYEADSPAAAYVPGGGWWDKNLTRPADLLDGGAGPAWFDIDMPDTIYLETQHAAGTGAFEDAEVSSAGNGGTFDRAAAAWEPDSWLEDDGAEPPDIPVHVKTRVPIAKVALVGGSPAVTVATDTNLVNTVIVKDGRVGNLPVPMSGGIAP